MKPAEKLAVAARKSISKYCFTECNAYCCRSGFLQMTRKQSKLLLKDSTEGITWSTDKLVLFKLEHTQNGCPQLEDHKCKVHKNKNRPIACKRFPLFIWSGKRVRFSPRCPAVQHNLLYPYAAKFKKLGYTIV